MYTGKKIDSFKMRISYTDFTNNEAIVYGKAYIHHAAETNRGVYQESYPLTGTVAYDAGRLEIVAHGSVQSNDYGMLTYTTGIYSISLDPKTMTGPITGDVTTYVKGAPKTYQDLAEGTVNLISCDEKTFSDPAYK